MDTKNRTLWITLHNCIGVTLSVAEKVHETGGEVVCIMIICSNYDISHIFFKCEPTASIELFLQSKVLIEASNKAHRQQVVLTTSHHLDRPETPPSFLNMLATASDFNEINSMKSIQ